MKFLLAISSILSLTTQCVHASKYVRKALNDDRTVDYEVDTSPLSPPDEGSLIEKQFSENPHKGKDNTAMVLSGDFGLYDIRMSKNQDEIMAYFCDFDFDQNKDPSIAPRYIDFYEKSVHCQEHSVGLPLHEIAAACRDQDKASSIEPDAFILNQPKSGSTILSNMLTVARPDTRVISEPSALGDIFKCEKCDHDLKVQALKDAMYLLGRSQTEGQLFVKIAARNTIGLPIIRDAFPNSKWVYVYRDTDTVLQKLMNKRHEKRVCGTYRYIPGEDMTKFLASHEKSVESLKSEEQACAAYLATQMSMVLDELEVDNTSGRLVAYEELLDRKSIEDLFDYLEVYSPNWDKVEEQWNKRANTGRGDEWQGEEYLDVSDNVRSATAEYQISTDASV